MYDLWSYVAQHCHIIEDVSGEIDAIHMSALYVLLDFAEPLLPIVRRSSLCMVTFRMMSSLKVIYNCIILLIL